MPAQVAFTDLVADEVRGRTLATAAASLQTAQGLGVLVAGGVAEIVSPSLAVAVCGAAGTVGVALFALAARRPTR